MAARRAANRLGSVAQVVHLGGVAANEGRLVLVRPGVQLDAASMKRAAEGRSATPAVRDPVGPTRPGQSLTTAQRAADAARKVDPDRVGVDVADVLSAKLDEAIEALVRLSQQLRLHCAGKRLGVVLPGPKHKGGGKRYIGTPVREKS